MVQNSKIFHIFKLKSLMNFIVMYLDFVLLSDFPVKLTGHSVMASAFRQEAPPFSALTTATGSSLGSCPMARQKRETCVVVH